LARIAVDAMGGDHAPRAPLAGALLALGELDPTHVLQLVGRTRVIEEQLENLLQDEFSHLRNARDRLAIVEAPDVIGMSEKPSVVVRGKRHSSMVVGLALQSAGKSDAFVSAGNTGAQMAASVVLLKLHVGLTRPAIGTVVPTALSPVVIVDSGANVDCSAEELLQFARLGAVYAEDILERPDPVVALLNVGEEAGKGSAAVKEAHKLLRDADLNFQGNIEGRDVAAGASEAGPIDVVVCDGFVGNVLLKFYEAVAPMMLARARNAGLTDEQLARAFPGFDYTDTGGAPLLGVQGVSIISHGDSSPREIKNAIRVALRAVESRMTEHVGRRLELAGRARA
jgi:phosphate acyltransferase